jgi:ABC-type transport system involved in multi-copper enzyme maturation permease subunit
MREMVSRKLVYLLVVVAAISMVGGGMDIFAVLQDRGSMSDGAFRNALAKQMGQGLSTWFNWSALFAVVYGAAAFRSDLSPRILHDILIRPVSRHDYLVGRWLGIVVFFLAFGAVGTAFFVSGAIYWGSPPNVLFAVALFYEAVRLAVFTALSLVLSVVISPIGGGVIAFLLLLLRPLAGQVLPSAPEAVENLVVAAYYVAPAQIETDLLPLALQRALMNPDYGLYWSVIGENVLYAGVLLMGGTVALHYIDLN